MHVWWMNNCVCAHIRGGRTNELVGECMGVDGLMLAGESEWVDGRMHEEEQMNEWCISYFPVAVIKCQGQRQLWKEEFILAYGFGTGQGK